MKFVTKNLNVTFDDEDDEEEIGEEEQSEDEIGKDQEQDQEDEDDEGDEVEDDEDFVEDKENVTTNIANSKEVKQRLSLGDGGDKKIILAKPQETKSKKPTTQILVDEAIKELNERAGSSVRAIQKFILSRHPSYDEKRLNQQMKRYIKKCVIAGTMIQIKQSFKLIPEAKKRQMEKKKPQDEKEMKKNNLKKAKTGKSKEKQKTPAAKTKKSDEKPKEKAKVKITPKGAEKPAEPAAVKAAKQIKSSQTEKAKENAAKTEKLKPKVKLGRKSINLVVRKTPPRAKIMKKTKTTAAANKKEIALKVANDTPPTTSAASMKANRKAKN